MAKLWTKENFNKLHDEIDFIGLQDNPYGKDFLQFNDLVTGDTLSVFVDMVTPEEIQRLVNKSRTLWGIKV